MGQTSYFPLTEFLQSHLKVRRAINLPLILPYSENMEEYLSHKQETALSRTTTDIILHILSLFYHWNTLFNFSITN